MLNEIGALSLREEAFRDTDAFEFLIALSRRANGCPLSLKQLLARTTTEEAGEAGTPGRLTQASGAPVQTCLQRRSI